VNVLFSWGLRGGLYSSEYAGQLQVLQELKHTQRVIPARVMSLLNELTFSIVKMFVKNI
jgi:hypothetical protein